MVEQHKTLTSVSVNIVDGKFLEFALKKVKYGETDRLMLSISKGNVMSVGSIETRRHSKALSIPFEAERMKRILAALNQVITYGIDLKNGGSTDVNEKSEIKDGR